MYLYYPLLNPDDKIYDCSGTESGIKDAKITNFPASITDSFNFNMETNSIPVSSYYIFSGNSKIESENIIDMPSDFTITFWMRKTTINTSQQIIFRVGGFKIYTLSTNLFVEYNGSSYSIPVLTGKWGYFSIRQGTVDVYDRELLNKIEENKRILHITSSFIDDSASPISYINSTSAGNYDVNNILPTIYDQVTLSAKGIVTIQEPYVFSRNLLNIVEKNDLFDSPITGSKFYLLENFRDTLCEFRIWDKLVDDYKVRVIQKGSYIFSVDGDLTQNISNINTRIESIREVNKIGGGIDYDGDKSTFMHAQSVSTLSTHNEDLRGELFPIEVKNSSFPPNSLMLNGLGVSNEQIPFIFENDPTYLNSYPPEASNFLVNTTISDSAYVKENFNGTPNDLYFAQVVVSAQSDSCSSIEIYSDNSNTDYIATKNSPAKGENVILYGIIKMNEAGEFYIKHNYPPEQIGTQKSLAVLSIILINVSENGIFDFFNDNGYNSTESMNLAMFLTIARAYKDILFKIDAYVQNVEAKIRLFPAIIENIVNLAGITPTNDGINLGIGVNEGTRFIDNDSLYTQLISTIPYGVPLWVALGIPEEFVNGLFIPNTVKAITRIEKYFLSMPKFESMPDIPEEYNLYIKGLEPNKEYNVRIVIKNLSNVPEMTPTYLIVGNNFSHLTSQMLLNEDGTNTIFANPLVASSLILNEVIPSEYVKKLPIDDIEVISAFVFSDANGHITFKREYDPIYPDDPMLKTISLYDISVLDTTMFRTLEKSMDLSVFKESILPSSVKTSFENFCNAFGVPLNVKNYYLKGIDDWIDSMLFSSIAPYLIPPKEHDPFNFKEMLVEFYPPSRRKKYTIQNLQHTGNYSAQRVVPSGTTTLLDYNLNTTDTADKLMYYSYNVKSNTGSPITVTLKAVDQSGNVLGTATTKTVSTSYTPISILIREGWNNVSNNKIKSIKLETNGSCFVKYSVECDLTSNGIEDWLTNYNLRTLVYKDGFSIKVNTNEKKVFWCDNFLNYEYFIPGNGFIVYNMASPYLTLKSSEQILEEIMNDDENPNKVLAYSGYLAELTGVQTNPVVPIMDAPITQDDFFPFAWVHRSGSTDFSPGKRVHGVGIVSGEILEVKDIE